MKCPFGCRLPGRIRAAVAQRSSSLDQLSQRGRSAASSVTRRTPEPATGDASKQRRCLRTQNDTNLVQRPSDVEVWTLARGAIAARLVSLALARELQLTL